MMEKRICDAVEVLVEALRTLESEKDLGCARLIPAHGCLVVRAGTIQIVIRDVGKQADQSEKGPYVEWRWVNER